MNALQPFQFGSHNVRVATHADGSEWWILADVCRVLEIKNSRDVAKRLDADEKDVVTIDTPGGPQSVTIVNEPGLYSVIFKSTKPEARAFKRWVFHEVLPQLRKRSEPAQLPPPPSTTQQILERELRTPDGHVEIIRYAIAEDPTPAAAPAPLDLADLRRKFDAAVKQGTQAQCQGMSPDSRGLYLRGLNSKLKACVCGGRARSEWTEKDYRAAVAFLRTSYGVDVSYVLS